MKPGVQHAWHDRNGTAATGEARLHSGFGACLFYAEDATVRIVQQREWIAHAPKTVQEDYLHENRSGPGRDSDMHSTSPHIAVRTSSPTDPRTALCRVQPMSKKR
jgi:hypothetical protein